MNDLQSMRDDFVVEHLNWDYITYLAEITWCNRLDFGLDNDNQN